MALIIDLTRMLAGPFATVVLGDLNHRIIKVEEKRIGDATRHHPPYQKGVSAYFFSANRNKESIILDLKRPEGIAVLMDLVRGADAVIENFRPGVMDGLGLSYAALKAVNPGIVLVSITGFGSYGTLRDHVSFDLVAQAMSGAMLATTPDPGEPIKPALALGDLGSGLFGSIALLTALLRRKKTGVGTHMEVSLLDVMLTLANRVAEGELLKGSASEAPSGLFPDDIYPTSDGALALSAYTDAAWLSLCRVLGRENWRADARFATATLRAEHGPAIDAELRTLLAARPSLSWLETFKAAGVPAAKVRKVASVIDDEDLARRDMVLCMEHPVGGSMKTFGNPMQRPERPYRAAAVPSPRHGQHTRQILSGDLAYTEQKIDQLIESGVIAGLSPEPA
jgi:CoA:oxalate CoA-transferase